MIIILLVLILGAIWSLKEHNPSELNDYEYDENGECYPHNYYD